MTELITELKTVKLTLETKALLDEKGDFVKAFKRFECPACKHIVDESDGISYLRNDYTTLNGLIGAIDSTVEPIVSKFPVVFSIVDKAKGCFKNAKPLYEKEEVYKGELELTSEEAVKLGEYIKIILKQINDGKKQGTFNVALMRTVYSLYTQIGVKD